MSAHYDQSHHISEIISDSLYLTSAYGVSSPTVLREKGITCVVNATLSFQTATPNYLDIEFIRVPVDDVPSANIAPYFDRIADKIHDVKKSGGRCLVHCFAGRSRSATLVMVYLMKYEGMTLKNAYIFVRGKRPMIHPNTGFWGQMISYERNLTGCTTVKMIQSAVGWIPELYEDEMTGLVW